ncbi:hypothetical protein B0T21DRAFT_323878 [Apiosordaria backusii]|uniref:Small ribosomal subunit protein mS38 n=1 Tax=Apiosordaria backusii TaxID=314023 RepID=A0AA40EZN2_9PEZI|nr:hypothetical protein B0T21DRAFT_323878 [Apiosordaria backusii]
MLPLSVRRAVASAAPQSPATVVSSLAASAPKAAYKANSLHQRRYSSSKPSSPDDGTRDFAARPSVPASGNSKTTGEKRKRKAKDAGPQLPSVPSTKHIKDEALALSTFFALHRPISVTQLLPKTVTEDAFAEIFNTRSPRHRVSDVLSTLSQTVHDLEEPLSSMNNEANTGDKQQQQMQQDMQEAEDGFVRLKRADGSGTNVYFQLNSMAGQFLPYAPPPAPEPMAADGAVDALVDELAGASLESSMNEEPQTRVYKAMVTIEETVEADGQYKVVAHSPELIDNVEQTGDNLAGAQPRTFLERMALRQLKYDESRRLHDRTMQAISVKRQRKLKMKKKKYKKLQKRTRNERRKLDRL